jgi:hypothetical protein
VELREAFAPFSVELATGIRAVPVLHGRLESAFAVAATIRALRPDHVCVELPVTMGQAVTLGVERLPRISVVEVGGGGAERPSYLLIEPCEPLIEAVRSALELGIPCHFVDRDMDGYPERRERWPDPHAASRIGYAAYCEQLLADLPPSDLDEDRLRERTMAHQLQRIEGEVLLVTGLAHIPGLRRALAEVQPLPIGRWFRDDVRLLHLHHESVGEVLAEFPFLQRRWETFRPTPFERDRAHLDLVRQADARFFEEEKQQLKSIQRQQLFQYARNLALIDGLLAPRLVELLLAGRGVADDNFAWWLWQEATTWEGQDQATELPALRIGLEDLRRQSRAFHFHRKQRSQLMLQRLVRPRPVEARPGEWRDAAGLESSCSHIPEDLRIEAYAAFLRQRTVGILSAEQTRVQPFTTSLLDGVDLRETIRNMPHDGRIWVREQRPVRGKVGSVVIVFDRDPGDTRYPFRMTWQGEHEEESDMAFYSTAPLQHMVGPGISRCEYGGLLMSWPPFRMFGVWEQEVFDGFPDKAERLLVAGILYSDERLVTYIADKPPRAMLRSLAARFDRKIVYIPIGQLSPLTLARIRSFHILHGKHIRSYAARFVR